MGLFFKEEKEVILTVSDITIFKIGDVWEDINDTKWEVKEIYKSRRTILIERITLGVRFVRWVKSLWNSLTK